MNSLLLREGWYPSANTSPVTSLFSHNISADGMVIPCISDTLSEVTCDDDTIDMAEGDIHNRDWEVIGSEAPGERVDLDYFWMMHVDRTAKYISKDPFAEMVFPERDEVTFEVVPVYAQTLERYYKYFTECGAIGHRGDKLLNLCYPCMKSPVFDVQKCMLVRFEDGVDSSTTAVNIGGAKCGVFIPANVTDCIIDQLFTMGIQIEITSQDTWSYATSRVTLSPYINLCQINEDEWEWGPSFKGLAKHVKYDAVATAILTISVLLSPCTGSRGKHSSKYTLKYIIHNVK